MDDEVRRLFHEIADLSREERERILGERAISADLRAELESLLSFDSSDHHDLTDCVAGIASLAVNSKDESEFPSCGPYKLTRLLARGGMGEVYLGERADGEIEQKVAIKLLNADEQRPGWHERFLRERQVLASLSHPSIVRVIDAGNASDGQPYLVMEYVEGVPINVYAGGIGLRERLALFLAVCEGVLHAHHNLIVHRDLKPSNILVDAAGQPKLLDFGIAKLLSNTDGEQTALTQAGGRLLTPDYASPEQITGRAVTTATDVYALGTVLFELLAGEHPWKERGESRAMLEEAILHADPPRPSDAAHGSRKIAAALRGDLDSIVLKALKKAPGERYATADAFAEDVKRYLAGEAVLAQPDSASYRARKFLSRHKVGVGATAAILFALAAGSGVALWQARIARTETRTAVAVESFLEDIFRANSSSQTDPLKARQTTARELLDIGARKIDAELAGAPPAKLRVLDTLGSMYADLGLDDQAVAMYRKRLSLARLLYGKNEPAVAVSLIELASALHASQSVNEREAVLMEAKRILDSRGDVTSHDRGLLDWNLAQHYQSSDLAKAQQYAREATGIYRKVPPDKDLAAALYEEASIDLMRGQLREAEPVFTEAIEVSTKVEGAPNPDLPRLFAYLGETQQKLLEFGPAEKSFERALDTARRLNGDDHVDTVETELRLGQFLFATSRIREGLQYLERAKDTTLRTRGSDDAFYTPQVFLEYGWALVRSGRLEEGLDYISRAVDNRRKNRPGTRYLAQMLEDQARVLLDLGRTPAARKALEESEAINRQVNASPNYLHLEDRVRLLLLEGHHDAAQAAIEGFEKRMPTSPAGPSMESLNVTLLKAETALSRGNAAEAVGLGTQARQALSSALLAPFMAVTDARAALVLGRGEFTVHRSAEALPLLRQSVEIRTRLLDAKSPSLAEAQVALAMCEIDLGQRSEAAALFESAKAIHASHRELALEYKEPLRTLEQRLR